MGRVRSTTRARERYLPPQVPLPDGEEMRGPDKAQTLFPRLLSAPPHNRRFKSHRVITSYRQMDGSHGTLTWRPFISVYPPLDWHNRRFASLKHTTAAVFTKRLPSMYPMFAPSSVKFCPSGPRLFRSAVQKYRKCESRRHSSLTGNPESAFPCLKVVISKRSSTTRELRR
jgi:hypothetical protein